MVDSVPNIEKLPFVNYHVWASLFSLITKPYCARNLINYQEIKNQILGVSVSSDASTSIGGTLYREINLEILKGKLSPFS